MSPRYTESIDNQIAQALRFRGRIGTDGIAGVSEQDAAEFLEEYLRTHSEEAGLSFDGRALVLHPVAVDQSDVATVPVQSASAPTAPTAETADVQGVLGAGTASLLGARAPRGPQGPLRSLIIAGVIFALLVLCVPVGCVIVGGLGAREANSSWPASSSGHSTFYYFGADT